MTLHKFKSTESLKYLALSLLFFLSGTTHAEGVPVFLSWNKIGCQSDDNNKINLTQTESNLGCLMVCKNSQVTYWLTTEDVKNIESVSWVVTGGNTNVTSELTTSIKWGGNEGGSIEIRLVFADHSVMVKEIQVCLTEPVLLLSWDSKDCIKSSTEIEEMRFDENASNANVLPACENSGVVYKLSGSDASNITSIQWSVTGGSSDASKGLTCPVKWDDNPEGTLQIQIGFTDNRTLNQTLLVVKRKKGAGNVDMAPNSIRFNFDSEGNQVKREIIYLSKIRDPNAEANNSNSLKNDTVYDDISYYPNPVKQELFIKWKNPNTGSVNYMELYNVTGNLLKISKDLKNVNSNVVDFNNYPSGMYSLKLVYSNGESKTLKIIKE